MSNKKINRNWELEFYKELWEFLVNYEQLMLWIKNWIIFLMWNYSNHMAHQHCIQLLISELSSVQLIHKHFALFSYIFPRHNYLGKIEKCTNCALSMNEVRNNLIHRRYLVWFYSKDEETFTKVSSSNPKTKKSWLNFNFKLLWTNDIKIYNDYLIELSELFQYLSIINDTLIIDKFINYDEKKLNYMKKTLDNFLKNK